MLKRFQSEKVSANSIDKNINPIWFAESNTTREERAYENDLRQKIHFIVKTEKNQYPPSMSLKIENLMILVHTQAMINVGKIAKGDKCSLLLIEEYRQDLILSKNEIDKLIIIMTIRYIENLKTKNITEN